MLIRQSWKNMNMTNMVFSSILSNTPILYSIEQLLTSNTPFYGVQDASHRINSKVAILHLPVFDYM